MLPLHRASSKLRIGRASPSSRNFSLADSGTRLYQMEINRRLCSGRLSEIFGEKARGTDKLARVLGFRRLNADSFTFKQFPEFPQESGKSVVDVRALVESYLSGINAFMNDKVSQRTLQIDK